MHSNLRTGWIWGERTTGLFILQRDLRSLKRGLHGNIPPNHRHKAGEWKPLLRESQRTLVSESQRKPEYKETSVPSKEAYMDTSHPITATKPANEDLFFANPKGNLRSKRPTFTQKRPTWIHLTPSQDHTSGECRPLLSQSQNKPRSKRPTLTQKRPSSLKRGLVHSKEA